MAEKEGADDLGRRGRNSYYVCHGHYHLTETSKIVEPGGRHEKRSYLSGDLVGAKVHLRYKEYA